MPPEPLVSGRALGFWYHPDRPILRRLDFDVLPGRVTAVCGPSGSGKSTLLALIAGLARPCTGTLTVQLGAARPCCILQTPVGSARRTAIDHVQLVLTARRSSSPTEAQRLLDLVGLGQQATTPFGSLSGGEAQRLMLARAVAGGAPLVLLDEPTSQLDRDAAATVIEVVGRTTDAGSAVVVATHDPALVEASDDTIHIG